MKMWMGHYITQKPNTTKRIGQARKWVRSSVRPDVVRAAAAVTAAVAKF